MDNDYTLYTKPEYYRNRELSWLSFNERVLSEARDKSIPLFERLKFLSITSSNLDEFHMIRVASLKDMVHAEYTKPDIAGMTPKEQLKAISEKTHEMVQVQYSTYNRSLLPALAHIGLNIISTHEALTPEQAAYVDEYFEENIYPVLTPMAMDSSRPFPLIRNKTLNIGALIQKKDSGLSAKTEKKEGKKEDNKKGKAELEFATVQVPSVLPRFITLPAKEGEGCNVILLEEIIERNIGKLFLSYDVVCAHPYRVMRNADLSIDEDDAADLLKEIQKQLKKRQWGEVIRLEVEEKIDKRLLKILKHEFDIGDEDIFFIPGPVDLTFLMKMYGLEGFEKYKTPKYTPAAVPALQNEDDIFTNIRKGDILLHHPYQSFDPVVQFVKQAAKDPDVLAIKQTLYRVSGNSPIIAALIKAAENGKQVTVLVELKARFDEENNINWAKKLEHAGCHVIYGLTGLKTHCKILLVVRKEEGGIRRYLHMGTGNYNDSTARFYTDIGMFTCKDLFGVDASSLFNVLTGYSIPPQYHKMIVAPGGMRSFFERMIRSETENARKGLPSGITVKVNSLVDPEIIRLLYEASQAGVEIKLIVRGICCLIPGLPGVSENITVYSIVGQLLEHSRIFKFENAGNPKIYMGSADWMPRNLDRRVELVFPIDDQDLKERAFGILELMLSDTVNARIQQPDTTYAHIDKRGKAVINSQTEFARLAREALEAKQVVDEKKPYVPKKAPTFDQRELED